MKNYSLYIVLICCCFFGEVKSQVNLVPNPSFEVFSYCDSVYLGLSDAPPWYNPTGGSPDYFNQCSTPGYLSVPSNFAGFQYAKTGVAYAGICVYGSDPGYPSVREYLQVELSDTLIATNHYCVSFYVSNTRIASTPYSVAITKMGLLFSNNAIISSTQSILPYTPQITSPANIFLSDSLGWTEISGTFIASGGEKYITIGNFNNDANTDTIEYNSSAQQHGAYYYIDDVSVVDCTNQGVEELTTSSEISLFPNPATSTLTLEIKDNINNNQPSNIIITDVLGETVFKQSAPINNQSTINITQLSKGIYFLEVQTVKGITRKKFVKQ